MPKFLFRTVLALTLPVAAICQTTQPPCAAGVGNFAAQAMAARRTGVGTPYSLTATIHSEMKLYDGNTISGFTTLHQARDSQGRTRVEQPTSCVTDKDHQPHWQGSITVTDPVAKTSTIWQENMGSLAKTASVTHQPSLKVLAPPTEQQEYRNAQQLSRAYEHGGNQSEQMKVDDLGKRNFAGREASGFRTTRTVPAGAQGNSMPLTYMEERWISDQYGIILLNIVDDPIFGKSTYEVTNFTRDEPDASLFQPPADYKIEERTLPQ